MKVTIDQIPDYIENRLSAEEIDQISKMIKTDRDWQKTYEEMLSVITVMRQNKTSLKEIPEDYWNNFSARLKARIYKKQHRQSVSKRRFQLVFPITAVACAVLIFMFMIVKTNQKIDYVYNSLNWTIPDEDADVAVYSNDADQLWENYFGSITESEINVELDPLSGTSSNDRITTDTELNALSQDEELELLKELNENVII